MLTLAKAAVAATVAMLGLMQVSKAGVIEVSSTAALGANDSVDWGQLGPPRSFPSTPATATSAGGLTVTASTTGAFFERLDQAPPNDANHIALAFTPGDHLLAIQPMARRTSLSVRRSWAPARNWSMS